MRAMSANYAKCYIEFVSFSLSEVWYLGLVSPPARSYRWREATYEGFLVLVLVGVVFVFVFAVAAVDL